MVDFLQGIQKNQTSEVLFEYFFDHFLFYTCTYFLANPSINLCSKELCSIPANPIGQSFLMVILIMRTGAALLSLEATNVLNRMVSSFSQVRFMF
jgi:hypothetical protein